MQLAEFKNQPGNKAAEWTAVIAQQPVPARQTGIQSPLAFPLEYTRHAAENIFRIHGIRPLQGRVRRGDQVTIRTEPYEAVQHQATVILEQKDAAGTPIIRVHRAHQDGFAGANNWIHARPEGREPDGIPPPEEFRDQMAAGLRPVAAIVCFRGHGRHVLYAREGN